MEGNGVYKVLELYNVDVIDDRMAGVNDGSKPNEYALNIASVCEYEIAHVYT